MGDLKYSKMEVKVNVFHNMRNYKITKEDGFMPTSHEIYGLTIDIRSPISWMVDIILNRRFMSIPIDEPSVNGETTDNAGVSYTKTRNNYHDFMCIGTSSQHEIYGVLHKSTTNVKKVYETIVDGVMTSKILEDKIYNMNHMYGSIKRYG